MAYHERAQTSRCWLPLFAGAQGTRRQELACDRARWTEKARPGYTAQIWIYQAYPDVTEYPGLFTAFNADTCERLHLLLPSNAERAQAWSDRAVPSSGRRRLASCCRVRPMNPTIGGARRAVTARGVGGDRMGSSLTPIAGKLANLVRLSSDRDREVIAAACALTRTLKNAGTDIHALADQIEKPSNGRLSQADMKRLYDEGYSDGLRAAENNRYGPSDFHNTDGTPDWNKIALFCQRQNHRRRKNERNFIDDKASRTVWHEPTERQAKWLRSIFHKVGGRL